MLNVASAKCLDLPFWPRTMQVPFVLRFYYPDKIARDKINRLIHGRWDEQRYVAKKLLYVLKLFRVTADCIHSFRIRSKETLRIMHPKYPVLDPPPL